MYRGIRLGPKNGGNHSMQKSKPFNRVLALILTAAMILTTVIVLNLPPLTAYAAVPQKSIPAGANVTIDTAGLYDIATADDGAVITISADGVALTGTHGSLGVVIDTGITLTLRDAHISRTNGNPIWAGGADCGLILVGDNSATANGGDYAGVCVQDANGGSLIIEGPGQLTAKGAAHGAGIGGNYSDKSGEITIRHATVTATAGGTSTSACGGAAGIGSGGNTSSGLDSGPITIINSSVTATGGNGTGATLPANAGRGGGAGIGGGGGNGPGGNGSNITITDSSVIAKGGNGGNGLIVVASGGGGAGIGGGGASGGATASSGNGTDISIIDSSVQANGGSPGDGSSTAGNGSGVGGGGGGTGGAGGNASNITITDDQLAVGSGGGTGTGNPGALCGSGSGGGTFTATELGSVTADGPAVDLSSRPDSGYLGFTTSLAVTNPENTSAPVGGNAGFSVTASGGRGMYYYQWQEYNGSTWDNIINGGIYSGAMTSALTLTGVTATDDEKQYRCAAYDATWEEAVSNSAELTIDDAYIITTAAELDAVRGDLTANYRLGNDIDLTGYLASGAGYDKWGDAGWLPIGTNTAPFTGKFNGAGYKITGLWIERLDNSYVGLFGCIRNAVIENLGVELDAAGIIGGGDTGALVGRQTAIASGSSSTIKNCYATGNVAGAMNTNYNVGGLVGQQYLTIIGFDSFLLTTYIQNCYATGNVMTLGSGNTSAGGLVGKQYSNGGGNRNYIQNCYATGNVYAYASGGGIVGVQNADSSNGNAVEYCYSTGIVYGGFNSGGIVGLQQNYLVGNNSVLQCVAAGNVFSSGYDPVSGVIGQVGAIAANKSGTGMTTDYCYRYEQLTLDGNTIPGTDPNSNIYGKNGTPKTMAELMTKATYTDNDWLFNDSSPTAGPWYWDAGDYPKLNMGAESNPLGFSRYLITYNLNGGMQEPVAAWWRVYEEGVGLTLPAAPTRAGYTFAGWYDNAYLTGSPITAISPTATGNKEFWAKWSENPDVTITYAAVTDGSLDPTAGGSVTPTSQSVAPATGTASSTAAPNTGYSLEGWYTAPDTAFITKLASTLEFSPAKVGGLNVAGSYVARFVLDATYGVSLDQSGTQTFTAADYGYGAQTPLTVTVTNTGNQATGALIVALSGTNPGAFTLSDTSISSISVSGTDTFTIVQNTGLSVGTYSATVTISGDNDIASSFDVNFTVNKATGASVSAPALASKTGDSLTVTALTAPANGQTVEYAINTSDDPPPSGWQTTPTFDGLNEYTRYYIFARSAANANYDAGTPSSALAVYTKDVTPPTATIEYKNNGFKSFMNTVTFGLFFKKNLDVTIKGADTGSGVAEVAYYQAPSSLGAANSVNLVSVIWETVSGDTATFSIEHNEKFILYVRVTDSDGNTTYYSDGVVVYTDSEATVSDSSFSKGSTSDFTVPVTMNGNTVKEITNSGYTLVSGTDYTTSTNSIVFKNAYLKNLADGTASFIVSYYPGCETGTPQGDSETPGTTTITVGISRAAQTITITGLGSSYTYGAADFGLSVSGGSGTGAVTYVSSNTAVASISGNTVTIHKAGTFTVTATKAADAVYNSASSTSGIVTVSEATPIVTLSGADVTYGTDVVLTATVTGAGVPPTGTITFYEDATPISSAITLSGGTASYTVTVPYAGNHSYSAVYSGQTDYYTAATGTKSVGVGLSDQTALVITGKPMTVTYGDSGFTLNTSGGSGSGTVSFTIPNEDVISITNSGTVTINNAGTVIVTATKSGDSHYNATTATLEITVLQRDISNVAVTITGSTVYTGTQLQPAFTVSDGTLAIDNDDYANNYGANVTVAQGGTITLTGHRNYTGTKTVSFAISKAIPPTITFPTPVAVDYSSAKTLADVTLSGSGDGVFTWDDDTIIPTVGNSGYAVNFTPNDTANFDYTGVIMTATVQLAVNIINPVYTATGDNSNMTLWLLLGGAALIVLSGMIVIGRKKRRDRLVNK